MREEGVPETVGPWRVNAARTVYDNPWIRVIDHAVTHPDGTPGQYGVVRFKNRAIGILPIDEEGFVYLVGQHRFPSDAYSWELPEGGGPAGEAPLDTAKRELAEETGLSAKVWAPLIELDLSNSITDEVAICYLACELEGGTAHPESSEALQMRRIPFKMLVNDVLEGRVRDSLTIVMALSAQARALRGELPEVISNLILKGGSR